MTNSDTIELKDSENANLRKGSSYAAMVTKFTLQFPRLHRELDHQENLTSCFAQVTYSTLPK